MCPTEPSGAPFGVPANPSNEPLRDDPARKLAALAAEVWDDRLEESPQWCTALGLTRGLHRLDEDDDGARARRAARWERQRERLEAIPPDALEGEDRLTRTLLHRQLYESIETLRHHGWEWELDPLGGPHLGVMEVAERHPLREPSDADALVARYRAIPRVLEDHAANLRAGLASGRTAPVVAYERVKAQVRATASRPAAESVFGLVVSRLPASWSDTDRARAATALRSAAEQAVRPAYARFLAFLETEYAGRARSAVGVSAVPGGEAAYRFAVRHHTTTTLSPERVHEIGLEELERNEAEMLEIARSLGHPGDLPSFLQTVGRDPAHRLATREAVLERYRAICRRMDARLPEAFRTLPRRGYEVRPLETWREQDAPAAYYMPPALDGSRPGTFYANTRDPGSWPTNDFEALSFHEAVPGHHLQIALALDLDLPEFRRHARFTAYIEGWAHYAERLADELGAYTGPLDRLGMLSAQAWRAARLVVDTGLHALGWTRGQAMDVMRRARASPESDVANEVDRYIVWPGQALAYKIGQRTFSDLRERARRRLGGRFSLPGFHDVVLRHGALPLSVLEDVVRLWEGDPPS